MGEENKYYVRVSYEEWKKIMEIKIYIEIEMLKFYDEIINNPDDFIKQYNLPPSLKEEIKEFFKKAKSSILNRILTMIDTYEFCSKSKDISKYYINPFDGDLFCSPNVEAIINDKETNKKYRTIYM